MIPMSKSFFYIADQAAKLRRERRRNAGPHPRAKVERNADVVRRYEGGQSLNEIAVAHDISRERVKEIIRCARRATLDSI
jgi:hypothetical protein